MINQIMRSYLSDLAHLLDTVIMGRISDQEYKKKSAELDKSYTAIFEDPEAA